jgi:hypothetical protein
LTMRFPSGVKASGLSFTSADGTRQSYPWPKSGRYFGQQALVIHAEKNSANSVKVTARNSFN